MSPKRCFIFFDGSSSNLDSTIEKLTGNTVIGQLYKSINSSICKFVDLKKEAKIFTGFEKGKDNIALYFSGPGSLNCKYSPYDDDKKIHSNAAGRGNIFPKFYTNKLMPQNKSNRFFLINSITGNGWQHALYHAVTYCCNLESKHNIKFIPFGYSRGGITAIAFTLMMSFLKKEIEHAYLIDPVAGLSYGALKNLFYEQIVQDGFPKVNPFWLGENVRHAEIFYATIETRPAFQAQLPIKYSISNKEMHPLIISDNTDAYIHFVRADHSSIGFKHSDGNNKAVDFVTRTIANDIANYSPNLLSKLKLEQHPGGYNLPSQSKLNGHILRPIAHKACNQAGIESEKYPKRYKKDIFELLYTYSGTQKLFWEFPQNLQPIVKKVEGNCDLVIEKKVKIDHRASLLIDFIKKLINSLGFYSSAIAIKSFDKKGKHLIQTIDDIKLKVNEENYTEKNLVSDFKRAISTVAVARGSSYASNSLWKARQLINQYEYSVLASYIYDELNLDRNFSISYKHLLSFSNVDIIFNASSFKENKFSKYSGIIESGKNDPLQDELAALKESIEKNTEKYTNKYDTKGNRGFFNRHRRSGYLRVKLFLLEMGDKENVNDIFQEVRDFITQSGSYSKFPGSISFKEHSGITHILEGIILFYVRHKNLQDYTLKKVRAGLERFVTNELFPHVWDKTTRYQVGTFFKYYDKNKYRDRRQPVYHLND
ncbi:MAG: hypothetical protein GY730_09175 [bacterium]|nr:hypothetical protein [bacterium]